MPKASRWFSTKAAQDASYRIPQYKPLGLGTGPNKSSRRTSPPMDENGNKQKPIIAGQTVVGGDEVAG